MSGPEIRFDTQRRQRTGVAEAVFCSGKSISQLEGLLDGTIPSLLLTRLSTEQFSRLSEQSKARLDYDPQSQTAIFGTLPEVASTQSVCIVAAGTSDIPVALEAERTLRFHGIDAPLIADVGVAGLWRLMDQIETIRQYPIVIAVAGMEGALFSVLAGLVDSVVVAVPTSVGYGVSAQGQAALSSALASCAPGIVTVNIDNGFGAAAAAVKMSRIRLQP